MTNTNNPESVNARLDRLESLFADMGDVLLSQSDAIAQVGEQTARNANAIAELTNSINNLVEQAAADRQQAAIDRQAWQAEIQRIWEYLLRQGGNGRNA